MEKPENYQFENKKEPENKELGLRITRRGFLKLAALAGIGYLAGDTLGKCIFRKGENNSQKFEELSEEFWHNVIEDVSRKTGEKITPEEIRADLIIKALRIPQGWTSGLRTENKINSVGSLETIRTAPELDRLIAEYFSNTVKVIDTDNDSITSSDPRDFNDIKRKLEEFKQKVETLNVGREVGLQVHNVIEKELKHLGEISGKNEKDCGMEFIWLPGGVPLFLRGYTHTKEWQGVHGHHLAETYKGADYIAIEGYSNESLGKSLGLRWEDKGSQIGIYSRLMKDLVGEGFQGYFLEVDARDTSKIMMDHYGDGDSGTLEAIDLPSEFYDNCFKYLKQENPILGDKIDNAENLKKLLIMQSTSSEGLFNRDVTASNKSKGYCASASVTTDMKTTTTPTGMELGQRVFADALSALKLHKLAQAMNEDRIKRGMIVDFEGVSHLSYKSFFIKYPQYAVEVVLRTINELLASRVGEPLSNTERVKGKNNPKNLEQMYGFFKKQDPYMVLSEIGKIPLFYVEKNAGKTVEIGSSQKKLIHDYEASVSIFDGLDNDVLFMLYNDEYIQKEIDKQVNNARKQRKD